MDTTGRFSRRRGGPGGGGRRDQIGFVHDVRDWGGGDKRPANSSARRPRARWVFDEDESGKLFLTSPGVAAGGDAALALIARIAGDDEAEKVATAAEWSWHRDADVDPFEAE